MPPNILLHHPLPKIIANEPSLLNSQKASSPSADTAIPITAMLI
jgi:hypothetical protein